MPTPSGLAVDLLEPDPATIRLADIANTLARICRFNGALERGAFYSVAQHCVFVSELVMDRTGDPRLAMGGLLHDAHESYWQDICHPVEQAMCAAAGLDPAGYGGAIGTMDAAIGAALGVDPHLFVCDHVRLADLQACATEMRDLVVANTRGALRALPDPWPQTLVPWPVDFNQIAYAFVHRFNELRGACDG